MKVKSESEVTQLCPTLSDPMDCSLRGSSIHGIFQARVLEWVSIAFSIMWVSLIQSVEGQPEQRLISSSKKELCQQTVLGLQLQLPWVCTFPAHPADLELAKPPQSYELIS